MKIITDEEAGRRFLEIIRDAGAGEEFLIMVDGAPVAKIAPVVAADVRTEESREAARIKLFERLRSQPAMNAGPWTRDELYDEDDT
jgi:antitoxin (DNA-binding transcriptional repressor) of toxin-antitoxin stability system